MKTAKTFDTRVEMLTLVPPGGRIAEIGVFQGSFSQQILDQCRPAELVLIDLWSDERICSGDVDGNNMEYHFGAELEATVRDRFAANPAVKIIKGCSSLMLRWPADSFDAVYIDGDHSYLGVRRDLENAYRLVRNQGWIMGHDYEVNPCKTDAVYDFGVKDAVLDFCRAYGESIHALGMDGCVSFAIQVHKDRRWNSLLTVFRRGATRWRFFARRAATAVSSRLRCQPRRNAD